VYEIVKLVNDREVKEKAKETAERELDDANR